MSEATTWFVVAAMAFADADGRATVTATAGAVADTEECGLWGLQEQSAHAARHQDPLSASGVGRACQQIDAGDLCTDWRISVVRDASGALLVDVEADIPPADDDVMQQKAWQMAPSPEQGAVLARWPAGSWQQVRMCVGDTTTRQVEAPHVCTLVAPDGKPYPLTFGRGVERRCAVLMGGPTGATLNAYGVRGGAGVEFADEEGGAAFPFTAGAGAVERIEYRLGDDYATLWHVEHILVATPL